MIFSRFEIFICIVTFLVIFETSDVTQVFIDSYIMSCIDIVSRNLEISSMLETMLLFSFFLGLFIEAFTNFFKARKGFIIIERLISQVLGFRPFFSYRILKK